MGTRVTANDVTAFAKVANLPGRHETWPTDVIGGDKKMSPPTEHLEAIGNLWRARPAIVEGQEDRIHRLPPIQEQGLGRLGRLSDFPTNRLQMFGKCFGRELVTRRLTARKTAGVL